MLELHNPLNFKIMATNQINYFPNHADKKALKF